MEASPELPRDILRHIFASLEVPDLTRAGSVCSSWRSAYTSLCNNLEQCRLQQQTPCLLYTSESIGAKAAGLYSLAEKKAYTLTIPDPPMASRYVIGSSYGWIVTADDRPELHLVNPITGEQIALPSVSTIEQVKPVFNDSGDVYEYEYSWYTGKGSVADSTSIFAPSELREYLFYKAFVSSDPSAGDYFVVLIHNPHAQLSFVRSGHGEWTWLPPHCDYEDCVFKGGLLYALTTLGEIHVFDLAARAVTQNIVMGKMKDYMYENTYLVEASCGDLLQVWRSDDLPEEDGDDEHVSDSEDELDPESHVCNTSVIQVHKVDFTQEKIVEISSLGENVLFLGHNLSLCLRAEEYPQLKANHVYFTDNKDTYIMGFKNNRRDIGVFDLENKRSEEIVSPQLWSNWPPPVWLIPNPRRMKSTSHIR